MVLVKEKLCFYFHFDLLFFDLFKIIFYPLQKNIAGYPLQLIPRDLVQDSVVTTT